jgi:hypothetical protein
MAQALQTYECKTSSNERKGEREEMKNLQMKSLSSLAIATMLVLCSTADASAAKASYLYTFSNFTGSLPYSWVRLASDKEHGEIYVINNGIVTVFNSVGMEIFHFGDEGNLGGITDVAVEKDGNIILLSYTGDTYSVLRCNFRGEPKETIQLRGLPQEFSQFSPRRLVYWKGYLYLADPFTRKIVVTDSRGALYWQQRRSLVLRTISSASALTGRETCFLPSLLSSGPTGCPATIRWNPLAAPGTLKVRSILWEASHRMTRGISM